MRNSDKVKIEMSKTATVLRCRCPLCGEEGILRSLEVLPKHGMAMECIHKDETTHQWAEYDSMEAVIDKNKRKSGGNPRIIICPVCSRRGRINEFHPNKTRPDIVQYLVTHEKLEGTWGKGDHKIAKRRRCYIKKPTDRITVLKKLGRYIPPVNPLEGYIEK